MKTLGPYSRAVAMPPRPVSAPSASSPVRTVERGGVLHVVNRRGESLGPVASPAIAESYGRALAHLGLL